MIPIVKETTAFEPQQATGSRASDRETTMKSERTINVSSTERESVENENGTDLKLTVKSEIGTVRLHLIIVSMSLSTFIVAMDRGIITTAMYRPRDFGWSLSSRPWLTDEFHSFPDVSWYGAAYLLAATAFQPLQ